MAQLRPGQLFCAHVRARKAVMLYQRGETVACLRLATRDGSKAGARRTDEGEIHLMVCNFPAVAPGFIAGACETSMSIRAGKSLAGIGRPK